MRQIMDLVLPATFVLAFAILTSSRVRRLTGWSATVTPLASIIGSGFLVSVPLIASRVGIWAVPAMAALTVVAFLLGGAIRYNIRYGEVLFDEGKENEFVTSLEAMSHFVLVGAYFVSVAYYLVLLSTFGLRLFGVVDHAMARIISSSLVIAICGLGATKGLGSVEGAEKYTVSINLSAIAALLACLALFATDLPAGLSWSGAGSGSHQLDWNTLRFLMGLLIVVQGFETSRFMGEMYDGATRLSAMQRAQLVSSAIYISFFILMIPLFGEFQSNTDVAGFIEKIGIVSPWLPYVVTIGAIASQFSASVADSIGGAGLINNSTNRRISSRHAYLLIAVVSVLVIWNTDVVSIVALASRAFALFYAMQALVAVAIAWQRNERGRSGWFSLLAAIAFAFAFLGIPAGG